MIVQPVVEPMEHYTALVLGPGNHNKADQKDANSAVAALHVSIPWSKIQNCLILPRLIPFQEKLQNAKFLF